MNNYKVFWTAYGNIGNHDVKTIQAVNKEEAILIYSSDKVLSHFQVVVAVLEHKAHD